MLNNKIRCGEINQKHLSKKIEICGWIKKVRKLGSLIFIDLYDLTGYCQIIVENTNQHFIFCEKLTKESTIKVIGIVRKRKSPNLEISTGKYEIVLHEITLFSLAKTPPLLIQDDTDALEDVRLKYRYLDLRRPIMQKNIIFRSKVMNAIRSFLIENNFFEIETPILSKQTPEGARDYLVPTRLGKFYALPQSPQLYKQLLMVAGFLKYFQIARCFRDEDQRADRQPEFTQLDIETSFLTKEEIMNIVELMIKSVFKKALDEDIKTPFIKMDYETCMNLYGTDKPDLRFDIPITDVSNFFAKTKNNIFKNVLKNDQKIKALIIKDYIIDKKILKNLEKFAIDNKALGIFYVFKNKDKSITQKISSFLEDEIVLNLFDNYKIKTGTIIFVAAKKEISLKALGAIRSNLPNYLDIKFKNKYAFLWVIDWPLFEYDEENKKYASAHHPFTMPTINTIDFLDKDLSKVKAQAYDIVLNGYEIGGGSVRIHEENLQKKVFSILGLSDKEIVEKFGFLLNAFNYGVPPHAGIAFGLDRLIMILINSNTIKDTIAFPKNSNGIDMMLNSPSDIDENFLKELKISKLN